MKSEDNNKNLDALDVILKEYLLSRDPKGPDGESLMASVMAGSQEENPLADSPSSEREAALLSALQKEFASESVESESTSTSEIPLVGATESPMDTDLKEYLIENNPKGRDGISLMQYAMESSSVNTASDVPSPEQEARMLAALKKEFVKEEDEDPVIPFWTWQTRTIAITVAAAAAIALFLLFNPFKGDEGEPGLDAPNEMAEGGDADSDSEFVEDKDPLTNPFEAPDNEFIANENTPEPEGNTPTFTPVTQEEEPKNFANLQPKETPKVNTPPRVEDMGPYPMVALFAQTASESQWFNVNNDRGQVIKGSQGTRIHIPADCFIDQNGQPIDGAVALELKEVYSGKDLLLSNMPTERNGKALVSGGSIFLEARKGPNVLAVADDKEILVEFDSPESVETEGMQLYQGEVNRQGDMNWASTGGLKESLIPMSTEDLQLEALYLAPEDIELMVNAGEASKKDLNVWNRAIQDASSAGYSDSWVRTREFLVRAIIAHDFNYDQEIVEIYTEESDSSMARADRLVAQRLRERGGSDDLQLAKVFDAFAAQDLGYVEKFRTYGVNFEAADAREKLASRKVSDDEIDRLMRIHELQQEYRYDVAVAVAKWKKRDQGVREMIAQGNKQWKSIVPGRSYELDKTGWANLNKPYKNGENVALQVSHTGDLPGSALNTYMVFQGVSSMIKAENTGNDQAHFDKVPKNVEGWIVSMGYQDSQPYFGYKRVKAGKNAEQRVTIRKTTMEALKKKLDNIL